MKNRLTQEFETVRQFLQGHPRISLVSVSGQPPDRYTVEYRLRSLSPALEAGMPPEERHTHVVLFFVTPAFPSQAPACRFLTPVFHPAIQGEYSAATAAWQADWQLTDLILLIGRLIAFQELGPAPAANAEAGAWCEKHSGQLPLDDVDLTVRPDVPVPEVLASPPAPEEPVRYRRAGSWEKAFAPLPPTDNPDLAEVLEQFREVRPLWRENSEMILAGEGPPAQPQPSPPPGGGEMQIAAPRAGRLVEPETGRVYFLCDGETAIGRGKTNDIVLDNSSVSRSHCRIRPSLAGKVLSDAGSTNGTFLNERRITTQVLRPGDRVRLGAVNLVYEE